MRVVNLGRGVELRVWPERRYCETIYPDGVKVGATRENTAQNRAQAREQGYSGPEAVWTSLLEHEALHTVLARRIWGQESLALRHEGGAEQALYSHRLFEEAAVIAFQRQLNLGLSDPVVDATGAGHGA